MPLSYRARPCISGRNCVSNTGVNNAREQETIQTGFIVIGAGIAGLRAAIGLADHADVLLVTKEGFGESNTSYAQGGIAVALGGPADVEEHAEDTINAGAGLVDPVAGRILVAEGPARVQELLEWHTGFDREAATGELMLTREGAHSRNRILHANGDATGAEIGRALLAHAQSHPAIRFLDWTTCIDLLKDANGRVTGALLLRHGGSKLHAWGRSVLLASGGAGQVYSDTTNPAVATGDGIAAAWRAGAVIADMEFYQFHPTALFLPGAPRFLLSEALRGEGAYLRNAQGERFIERYHPLLELAPRDVVARAIISEAMPDKPGDPDRPVYLDMRHVAQQHPSLDLSARFPGISAFLSEHNLRLDRDLIPIRPAAHYLMGGVATDTFARTSLPGLYAAGEVACTGVHGANRLASNSLLEGLVFGARAAESMLAEDSASATPSVPYSVDYEANAPTTPQPFDIPAARATLQSAMWRDAGLLRDREGLQCAAALIADLQQQQPAIADTREALELRNLLDVASLIVHFALFREESRGAHYRRDFPHTPEGRSRHYTVAKDRLPGASLYVDLAATGLAAIRKDDPRHVVKEAAHHAD
jgi:L-aspartate oxidase